jgi:IS30 family transposase
MGRHYTQLGAEERGVIMAMQRQGASGRTIATALARAQSTVARELRRNGVRARVAGQRGRPPPPYDAQRASARARRLRHRPRTRRKLRRDGPLWPCVHRLLQRRWSPAQIARTLRRKHPHDRRWYVSHETIYTALYAMPRGALRREATGWLRRERAARRSPRRDGRGRWQDLPSVHVRGPEAEARQVPGHWEGDLIRGARNASAIGVLVCRRSLFVKLVKLRDSTAPAVLAAFTRAFQPLPALARKTLTYDQGKEMALHRQLTALTGVQVFFADPSSPWQRGICENTNGLLRQYFPKGTDLSVHSQRKLDAVAWELNTRPRATLDWSCPADVFAYMLDPTITGSALDDILRELDALGD